MFQLKAQSKGLLLSVERANALPKYIRTDESKLRQVLVNLLGNAVKFTTTGSITLRVGLDKTGNKENQQPTTNNQQPTTNNPSTSSGQAQQPTTNNQQPTTITFEVEDTGPGIAPSEIECLFQPFVQTESGQKSNEGTGLGLAISQKFVHLMGGEITVSTKEGSGAVFRFNIQVQAVETKVQQKSVDTRQIVGLEAQQPSYRILVVEDKPENRKILVDLLTPVGFEVREAVNGDRAIALWESWSPHLIWMDIRMPEMDGFEATKQIKAICSTTGRQSPIIIALTGSVFEEDRRIALSVGCSDFVRKPFRAEEIFDKMAHHLGVRYVYTSTQEKSEEGETGSNTNSNSVTSGLPQPLTASDLKVMPPDWVEQLHQAAIKVNAKLVFQLIEQIPKSNTHLANSLTELVNNFCFEEIVELTQQ